MSREVRRVPMDWQHPMEWCERWDRAYGRVRMQLVPKALHGRDILAYYEEDDTPPDDSGLSPRSSYRNDTPSQWMLGGKVMASEQACIDAIADKRQEA